jgi:hypothetical protein
MLPQCHRIIQIQLNFLSKVAEHKEQINIKVDINCSELMSIHLNFWPLDIPQEKLFEQNVKRHDMKIFFLSSHRKLSS